MSALLRAYRYINILSIDTALGAVVCAMFFAKLISANVWIYGKIALGLSVWIIYTADHLMDARKVKGEASSERHRFHQRHFRVLLIFMIVAIVIDLVVVSFMRRSLLEYGIALSVVVALYLLISRYLKMLKEVFIAFIYTVGVMLPALGDREHLMDQWALLIMFNFFLIAVANLLVFSWFDVQKDRTDGHPSFVTFYGRQKTRVIVYGLFCALVAISIYIAMFRTYELFPVLILFIMMSILLLILRFDTYMAKEDRFRFAGDAVFFLPAIYLLVEKIIHEQAQHI
jgi:4-hydroxybenzoate polyprenyltransferase